MAGKFLGNSKRAAISLLIQISWKEPRQLALPEAYRVLGFWPSDRAPKSIALPNVSCFPQPSGLTLSIIKTIISKNLGPDTPLGRQLWLPVGGDTGGCHGVGTKGKVSARGSHFSMTLLP